MGSFFLGTASPGWQGCVVTEPSPGVYLVELFSWGWGDSTEQRLVRLEEMTERSFYDTDKWMRDAYEHSKAQQWEWERKEAG